MRVVCIDDEPSVLNDNRKVLTHIPEITDIQCFEFDRHATEYMETHEVDVVFLDIRMPGVDGIEYAKQLKFRHPRLNIIFVTGYAEYAMDAFGAHAVGYLLKPLAEEQVREQLSFLRQIAPPRASDMLYLQTFGNFEAYADGVRVSFPSAKAKELLAYLTHRRGAEVSVNDAAGVLYEDSTNERSAKSSVRTALAVLIRTLDAAGCGAAVVKRRGAIALDRNAVRCDYYDLLAGDPVALNAFTGEYMTQYSWGEATLAALTMGKN